MNQEILKSQNNYEDLTNYIKKNNINNIFIVCSNSITNFKIYDYFKNLEKRKIIITYFTDFVPNPSYESVCKGVEYFKKSQSNTIFAIGGGSAIDVAKCIKLYSNMSENVNYLKQEVVPNDVELLSIPTTAGTGSESTKFAVIYYKGEKQSISDESIIPKAVLFDPSLLDTLPLYQKKATLLDALSHSMESIWSVNSNQQSKQYAKRAISIILENIDRYLKGDNSVNENMLYASNLAGKAINITQTTAGHAMCYKLTSLYKISHGHAAALINSVLYPYMLENIDNCIDKRGKEYLLNTFIELSETLGLELNESIIFLNTLLDKLKLFDISINEDDIDVLVHSVNTTRIKNNPVKLTEDDIREIYLRLFDEIEKRKSYGSKRINKNN